MHANHLRFPECVREVYTYENSLPYNNDVLHFTAFDGTIIAQSLSPDGFITEHDESDIEYWIAHVLWWYDVHEYNAWTVSDVTRAAQLCQYTGVVLPKDELIKYCGISKQIGVRPYTWDQVKTRYNTRNHVFDNLAEGAD